MGGPALVDLLPFLPRIGSLRLREKHFADDSTVRIGANVFVTHGARSDRRLKVSAHRFLHEFADDFRSADALLFVGLGSVAVEDLRQQQIELGSEIKVENAGGLLHVVEFEFREVHRKEPRKGGLQGLVFVRIDLLQIGKAFLKDLRRRKNPRRQPELQDQIGPEVERIFVGRFERLRRSGRKLPAHSREKLLIDRTQIHEAQEAKEKRRERLVRPFHGKPASKRNEFAQTRTILIGPLVEPVRDKGLKKTF